jgi:hypothetical protein
VTRLVRPAPARTPDEVGERLHDAFVAVREAVLDDQPVVLCVDGPALLGQASPEEAAVACGLLGLARALAFEGRSKQWRVGVVAVDPGSEPEPVLVDVAASRPELSGQLLNVSRAAVGKVVP